MSRWCGLGGRRQRRRELAGGEGIQGAEAGGEFDGGQAALAVEPAEKIPRVAFPFLRIAFETTGDEVFVGSAAPAGERHDMVKAPNEGRDSPQTIKATAALARVDGLAQRLTLEKIRRFVRDSERRRSRAASRANLLRETHFDQVTGPAALHEAQHAPGKETAQRIARGPGREPHAAGEPGNGKAQAAAAFEMAMAEEVRINGPLRYRQAQTRHEKVFEVFPDLFGVEFFVFHGPGPESVSAGSASRRTEIGDDKGKREEKAADNRQLTIHRQKKGQRLNTESTESGAPRSQRRKEKSRSLAALGMTISRRAQERGTAAATPEGPVPSQLEFSAD